MVSMISETNYFPTSSENVFLYILCHLHSTAKKNFSLELTSIWREGLLEGSMAGDGVLGLTLSDRCVGVPTGVGLGSLKLVNMAWGESNPAPPALADHKFIDTTFN